MRRSSLFSTAGAPLLALFAAAPASSQSIRGELGDQSRATIHISVTVMPRFDPQAALAARGLPSDGSVLRYSLVRLPPNGSPTVGDQGKGAAPHAGVSRNILLLVVPD